jgi:tricorn protease
VTSLYRRFLPALLIPILFANPVARADDSFHPFLRRPDVKGDRVAFTAEGDIWLASISTGEASRITSHPGTEANPHFSPDGKTLAFDAQYEGGTDVYVMPVTGGMPKRLTWDPRGTRVVGWTPDGASVLFLSARANAENSRRLWKVPAGGGLPSELPIPRAVLASMANDGRRVAFVPISAEWQHWKHYKGGQADDIWLTDITTKTFRRMTTDPSVDTTPTWAGDSIYFISERSGLANLFRLNPDTGAVEPLTRYTDAEARYPSSDGKSVVFQHGNSLALYNIATGKVTELDIRLDTDRIHARPKRVPASAGLGAAAIGPTGKRVVVESRGQLISIPADEGDARILAAKPGSRSQFPVWSRDGKQIAFVSDRSGEDQVWVAPADGTGSPRQLTKDHKGPLGVIRWAPDGKHLVTFDRESRIILIDARTGATTLVDQADRAGSYDSLNYSAVFSPDGKYLAFNRTEPNWFQAVYIYDIATKKKTAVSSPEINSSAPAWDPLGKLLYFLQDREFTPSGSGPTRFFGFDKYTRVSFVTLAADTKSPFLPANSEEGEEAKPADEQKKDAPKEPAPVAKPDKPAAKGVKPDAAKGAKPDAAKEKPKPAEPALPAVKIDFEGLADRIADLPVPADRYQQLGAVEGRVLMLVGGEPGSGGGPSLKTFNVKDTKKKDVSTIASGVTDFDVSADGKKMLVRTGRQLTVIDSGATSMPGDAPKVDTDSVSLLIDPVAEWSQIFNEAWRIGRDFFYDPGLHGVDWDAVKTRYAARLKDVGDRGELNEVLGDMIAELITGHAYVGGGDDGGSFRSTPMGYLAADYAPDAGGKAYKITHILRGDGFDLANRSPLLAQGLNVKEGDYILAISGQPVTTSEDIQAMLAGTPGRIISLTVNSKPAMKGSRVVRVRPMGDESKARYYDWAESRREYIRKNGGPNLGYIHLPDMGDTGLAEFTKHYYAELDKDGIIYDSRFNAGGYVSAMLMMQMARKPYTWFKPRYGASWTRQDSAFAGYSAMLVNERSFSNGEEWPDAFQREKLGPVIGVRSWGGEVGSGGGYRLVDGGVLNIPNYGEWAGGRWVIEGEGVQPDITVEQDPNLVLAGHDPQLDRAIAYLKDQIARKPVPRPVAPPYPVKAWKG